MTSEETKAYKEWRDKIPVELFMYFLKMRSEAMKIVSDSILNTSITVYEHEVLWNEVSNALHGEFVKNNDENK